MVFLDSAIGSSREWEQSHKIMAPTKLLSELIGFEDMTLPVYIKIGIDERIFGVIDYKETIDHIYIPTSHFYEMGLEENSKLPITILKEPPVKATKICLKPLHEAFYEIEDIKTYLETWLKKMAITLCENTIINLSYFEDVISVYVAKLEPATIVSIYEIEEVEIDFLPMDEYKKKAEERKKREAIEAERQKIAALALEEAKRKAAEEASRKAAEEASNNGNGFTSFSGKGHTLGSS